MNIPEEVSINYYEFVMTQDCNLRCKYCFDDFFGKRATSCIETSMSIETADKVIEFINKTITKDPNERVTFSFFGGEPTMNWDVVVYLTEQIKKIPHYKELVINTNVTLLNSERIKFLVQNDFGITMSLDGLKKDHDLNRSNSFDTVMKFAPELVVKSNKASALMVVDKNNYKNLFENYSFIQFSLGIHTGILFNYNSDWEDSELEYIAEALKKIRARGLIPYTFRSKEHGKGPCFDPIKNVSINSNGTIHFCHEVIPKMNSTDVGDSYGNVVNGYTNLEYFEMLKNRCNFETYKKGKICDECEIGNWCKTACVAANYIYKDAKSYDVINPNICKIQKIVYDVFYKEKK